MRNKIKVKKVLLGTTNPLKRDRLTWLLEDLDSCKAIYLEDINLNLTIEENGESFENNAILKANAYSLAYNGLAMSSDGGVTIPVLGKHWNGLLTHRFAGAKATDIDRLKAILKIMEPFQGEDRAAFWNEALAVSYQGQVVFSFLKSGEKCYLLKKYNAEFILPGFWMASLWFSPRFNKTYLDLSEEERNSQDLTWIRIKNQFNKNINKLEYY